MRQLVNNEIGQIAFGIAQHRAQHRIGKPSQRAIRAHRSQIGIIPFGHIMITCFFGFCAIKITPVGNSAYDRVRPLERFQAIYGTNNEIPRHRPAPDIDIRGIIFRNTQTDFALCKCSNGLHEFQFCTLIGRERPRFQHLVNGFCFPQKRSLPFDQLIEIPDLGPKAEHEN